MSLERIRCTPEQKLECKYRLGSLGCHYSVHHEYYPKADYKTPVERKFRELDENKVRICRTQHDEIHATEEPPIKPEHAVMVEAIESERARRILAQTEVRGAVA